MRISIINLNLVAQDAIGQCILHQIRFFRRRGDTVQVYTLYPPHDISDEIAQLVQVANLGMLMAGEDEDFLHSDLYIYHYPGRYPLLESMKGLDRGAVIFYYHNVTPPDLWGSSFLRDELQHSIDSVGLFTSYADLMVTDSQYNADQLVQEHGCEEEHVRVLPLAVPLERFSPSPADRALLEQHNLFGRQVILFVGRMAGNKRIDLLVEALPLVQERVPNALLLLVGDNQSNPAIQEMVARTRARAEELGVADDVIFTGTVPEVAPYFRLADVYATASLHEGFGVPLIEAMASGVPVVASRVTSHPWVLGEAGLLVEADNTQELAQALIRVLSDDERRGELVRRGLARVRDFSLEQYEIGWSKIVSEVTAWLPDQPIPRTRSLLAQPAAPLAQEEEPPATVQEVLWFAQMKQKLAALQGAADVMLRGYSVRSNLPIVGPIIAWIRRNLTSHLWQPYIDPTFERQIAFNRHILNMLSEIVREVSENNGAVTADTAPQESEDPLPTLSTQPKSPALDVETRLRQIETRLGLLSAQVMLLTMDKHRQMEASEVAEIPKQIEELRSEIREALSLTK